MSDEYFNIGCWLNNKFLYHKYAQNPNIRNMQVLHGEVWYCDLGFNVGEEKNKRRPVLIISNNRLNRTGKVVVLAITDAKGKINVRNLPAQDSWYLLYSATADPAKMCAPARVVPAGQRQYAFLDKDSVVQCEEIRSISKARLDNTKRAIGQIHPDDLQEIKKKFYRAYNI